MVLDWLLKHERVELIFLSKRGPKLNPIYKLWWWLKGKVAANRSYESLESLEEGCREYLSSLSSEDALRVVGLAA